MLLLKENYFKYGEFRIYISIFIACYMTLYSNYYWYWECFYKKNSLLSFPQQGEVGNVVIQN